MKKPPILMLLFCWANFAIFQSSAHTLLKADTIESKIEGVTVFLAGAQIKRTASHQLKTGTNRLIFNDISTKIKEESLQVKGEGAFTILSVGYQIDYLNKKEAKEEIAQLNSRNKMLVDSITLLSNLDAVYKLEEEMLLSNKSIGGQQTGVPVTALKEATQYFRERLTDIRTKQLKITNILTQIGLERNDISKQLGKKQAEAKGQPKGQIVVVVNSKQALTANFLLTYYSKNARWYPHYDLRVKDIEHPVALTYNAKVSQSTGIDWPDVRLTLSTGNPQQSGQKPELKPYVLSMPPKVAKNRGAIQTLATYEGMRDKYPKAITGKIYDAETGEGIPFANVSATGLNEITKGAQTDFEGNYLLTPLPTGAKQIVCAYVGYQEVKIPIKSSIINVAIVPKPDLLNEITVKSNKVPLLKAGKLKDHSQLRKQISERIDAVYGILSEAPTSSPAKPQATPPPTLTKKKPTNIEFNIDTPYSIESNDEAQTVEIQQNSLPSTYQYACVPKLDMDAFLLAQITDWADFNLLTGFANLFFEGTYIGETFLDTENLNDTLLVSLGRDQDISISREKIKEFSRRQTIGSNQKTTRGWRINVRNNKKQTIQILVEDQIPISTNKEIKIEKVAYGEAHLKEETGELSWKLSIPPAENKVLELSYSVKYPKNIQINIQ